jgi:hypothetical protein
VQCLAHWGDFGSFDMPQNHTENRRTYIDVCSLGVDFRVIPWLKILVTPATEELSAGVAVKNEYNPP